MTAADLFAAVGRALFGDRYKADMDQALGIRAGRSDDWSKRRGEPSPGVWRDLVTTIEQRERELGRLKAEALKLAAPRTDGGVEPGALRAAPQRGRYVYEIVPDPPLYMDDVRFHALSSQLANLAPGFGLRGARATQLREGIVLSVPASAPPFPMFALPRLFGIAEKGATFKLTWRHYQAD